MNIRQVRTKTKSVNNIKKITHAMELVSAIKMRSAQAAEIEGRPYRDNLDRVIHKIVSRIDVNLSPFLATKEKLSHRRLVIIVSSNKGLCGSFHVSIERHILHSVDMHENDFITVGKKAALFIQRMGGKMIASYSTGHPLNTVSAIFTLAMDKYIDNTYDSVSIIYNKFLSTFRSQTVQEILLPFTREAVQTDSKEEAVEPFEYLIEPSPQELIDPLLRTFIEGKIRGAVISSLAVEHSSRMVAMKNATDNANDVIYSLTLLGNKLRQGKITGELLDMITAKESVENA